MASAKLPPLQRQVGRVHRRLVLQSVLNTLVICWVGAILLAAGWFLLQPWVLEQPAAWLRWAVAGGLLALGTMVGIVLGIMRAPSKLAAALSLDAEFGLKERVTTSLTLAPEQETTPAGIALLADANQRVRDLDVGSRFPVRMSWTAALLPIGAALLAVVAVFYQPTKNSQANASTANDLQKPPPNADQINQKMKELVKKPADKPLPNKMKSEELKELEAELEKIANRPTDTKEQVRERIKEMTALEDAMKAREKEMAEKSRSLQKQLKQLDHMVNQKDLTEGPAKDLQKALAEGKLDKAREEIEKLARKMKNNELTAQEKEQLKKQLDNLSKKLDRAAKMKDKEEELKKANLDPETLKREMAALKKESQKMADMKELAQQLAKCQKAINEGDMDMASQTLDKAGKKVQEMDMEDDLSELREDLKRLEGAKDASGEAMDQGEPMERDNLEDYEGPGGIGAGRRPLAPKAPFKSFDAKNKGEFDNKGRKIFDGYAPGQNFRKRTNVEIAGEVKQASQEAPEAIEQQRIPKAAREMAKGYFQRMREQAEKELKDTPKK
jgi:hypothetical protein